MLEQRARDCCVIYKHVRSGKLARDHTDNCGECKRVVSALRAAYRDGLTAAAECVSQWPLGAFRSDTAETARTGLVAAILACGRED